MSSPTVNGEKPSSEFLSHLASYPVVSSTIDSVKTNPYGGKAINLADNGYKSFVAPVLPYAQRPYSFVSPYVHRADELATHGLSKVDSTFPIVRSEPKEIRSMLSEYAHAPFLYVGKSRDYLLDTWSTEYKKCGGNGYIAGGKALITTSLITASDSLSWLSAYLNQKKAAAKEVAKEKTDN